MHDLTKYLNSERTEQKKGQLCVCLRSPTGPEDKTAAEKGVRTLPGQSFVFASDLRIEVAEV